MESANRSVKDKSNMKEYNELKREIKKKELQLVSARGLPQLPSGNFESA